MERRENQSTRMKRYTKQTIITLGVAIFLVATTIATNNFLIAKKDAQYQLVNNAYNFWQASQYLTSEARNYIITGKRSHYDNYENEVNVAKRREIAKEKMYQIGLSETEKGLIEEIGLISNDLVPLEEEAMQAVSSIGDFATARTILYGDQYAGELARIEDDMMQLFFRDRIPYRERCKTDTRSDIYFFSGIDSVYGRSDLGTFDFGEIY